MKLDSVGPFATYGTPAWTFGPCTIEGQLGSKSNSRRLVLTGGKMRSIKSADALAFVDNALRQIPRPKAPYMGKVALFVRAYYRDGRRDLDVALLQDILQAKMGRQEGAGIIKNDRQVVEIHAQRLTDPSRPRVEFYLASADLQAPASDPEA